MQNYDDALKVGIKNEKIKNEKEWEETNKILYDKIAMDIQAAADKKTIVAQ